jgi:integrase
MKRSEKPYRRLFGGWLEALADYDRVVDIMTVPKSATKEVTIVPFTPAEVVAFLRSPVAQADEQLALLITLAMYTGARIEELAMLKKTDSDLKQEVIHFKGTKTKAADREVPMHPALIRVLTASVSDHEDDYVILG